MVTVGPLSLFRGPFKQSTCWRGYYASSFTCDVHREELRCLYVTTAPEALSATAANLAGIGATMSAQNSAAAAPTTGVVPAAADQELSAGGRPVRRSRTDVSGSQRPSRKTIHSSW